MWDAITTSMGKPNSPLRVIIIGTIAPSTDGWWADLIKDGTHGSVPMSSLYRGDRDKWDEWKEIRRVNPLTSISADFSAEATGGNVTLAYGDGRLKARFLSYRSERPIGVTRINRAPHRRRLTRRSCAVVLWRTVKDDPSSAVDARRRTSMERGGCSVGVGPSGGLSAGPWHSRPYRRPREDGTGCHLEPTPDVG